MNNGLSEIGNGSNQTIDLSDLKIHLKAFVELVNCSILIILSYLFTLLIAVAIFNFVTCYF